MNNQRSGMSLSVLSALLFVVGICQPAAAQEQDEKFALVEETQVVFATVGLYDGRNPGIVRTSYKTETGERTEVYDVEVPQKDGSTRTEQHERVVSFEVQVPVHKMELLQPGTYRFRSLSGKIYSANERKHLLWHNQPAIVVSGEFNLDPFYAKMLDPDTIVLEFLNQDKTND